MRALYVLFLLAALPAGCPAAPPVPAPPIAPPASRIALPVVPMNDLEMALRACCDQANTAGRDKMVVIVACDTTECKTECMLP